jgi:hypothetical protein
MPGISTQASSTTWLGGGNVAVVVMRFSQRCQFK